MRFRCCLVLALLLLAVSAFGQVSPAPALMNFQGRLSKPDGTPVSNGNYSVRFSLWTAVTGGTEKWNQTVNPVTVRNGTFAVLLNVASPANLFDTNLWLEIKIGTAAPLTPRQQLVSVAFAMKANTVPDNAITSAKIADGTITSADIANGTITAADLASGVLDFWKLTGNAGTTTSHFLGTTDNKPVVIKANNRQVMRYEDKVDAGNTYHTVNVMGGAAINNIEPGVIGATIAGGGQDNNSGLDTPNDVRGNFGVISGGSGNFIDAFTFGTIAGGSGNIVQGNYAVISGGSGNNIQSDYTTISGGNGNYAFGVTSTIGGGSNNAISANLSTIAGGDSNSATGAVSAIGGGQSNTSGGPYATIAGGYSNDASLDYATVGGGFQNTARNYHATVAGGSGNDVRGFAATVGGGGANYANADYATIPGGYSNTADGTASFAAGHKAYAAHEGSFVWSDNSHLLDFFASTAPNQFCIQAYGGVVLETGQSAWMYTSSTVGEKNRYFMLLNSPQTQSASGLKAGGILCADSFGYANPGKNDMVVKGLLAVGFAHPGPNTLAVNGSGFFNSFVWAEDYYYISDARYKTNVETLPDALASILKLRGVSHNWARDAGQERKFPEGKQIGFLAQEVEKVLPELVRTDHNGYKSVSYAKVVPVLVEAMKQQQKQITGQQKQLEELKAVKNENADLKTALAALLQRVERIEADTARK